MVIAKTAMLPTESKVTVDPRILLYAAQRKAPLPPGSVSKVGRWKAETLAACFCKASKHAGDGIPGQHEELWAAMAAVPRHLVRNMAEKAAFWVDMKKKIASGQPAEVEM